jgi:hypothetical protein
MRGANDGFASAPYFWRGTTPSERRRTIGVSVRMSERTMTTIICCAECGMKGGVSLKACKSCMLVKYCNPTCQRNHWATHKKICKQRAAEIRDEALSSKDPPPKEDCPNMLPTNANRIDMLCVASTRDDYVRLRFCDGK